MTIEHKELEQLNAQIQIKLAEGDLEAAERLSNKLVETAEGIQRTGEGGTNALSSMVSRFVNSVVQKLPQSPTAAQIAQIRESAINDEHLRLLSIFHFIYAGLTAFFSSVFLIYLGFGCMMLSLARSAPPSEAPPLAMFMIGFSLVMMMLFSVHTALNVFAGRFIRLRRRRIFCFVVSGLNLLHVPLGTILGVSSFLVLSRPSVKTAFALRSSNMFAIKGGDDAA
jgi:hypothetical protein